MPPLTAAQLRDKAKELPWEDVPIPEWGNATVRVRCLTTADLDAFEAESYRQEGGKLTLNRGNLRARFLVRCLVGEDGKLLFAPEQAAEVGTWPACVADRLFDVAQRLSKRRREDLEDAEKNSASAPAGASSSDSPSPSAAPSAS